MTYDHHIRTYRFVQEHEFQHMLWNVAQDHIINDMLLPGVTGKQENDMNEHVTNRMLTLPGMGKSKALKKWLKREAKRRRKAGLPKLKLAKFIKLATYSADDMKGYLTPQGNPFVTPRSNTRYNVADMQGNPVPDEVVAGNLPPWYRPDEPTNDPVLNKWANSIMPVTQLSDDELAENHKALKDAFIDADNKWDLPDEDGDPHSPVWYLDAYLAARETYSTLLAKDPDLGTQAQQDQHMSNLDDALKELDMYEGYVNRLFGYSGE